MDCQILADEATRIVVAAEARGVTMRAVGSVGIRLHCAAVAAYLDRFGRQPKDIDLVMPKAGRKVMRGLLEADGYRCDRDLLVATEGRRYKFTHPDTCIDIDVFVGRLEFCHVIEVRKRLREHPLTLPIEELLLSKLQIIEPTTTDLWDCAATLLSHPVLTGTTGSATRPATGPATGPDNLSASLVAGVLARDWGFHHTVSRNLERLSSQDAVLDIGDGERTRLTGAVSALRETIDATPKSVTWRLRAQIGERARWWQDIDERETTY
jgi:hypothetical protein